jgi:hypothetical protein
MVRKSQNALMRKIAAGQWVAVGIGIVNEKRANKGASMHVVNIIVRDRWLIYESNCDGCDIRTSFKVASSVRE